MNTLHSLIFSLFLIFSISLKAETYLKAGPAHLSAALDELTQGLEILNDHTLPHEIKSPKDLRKLVVKVRDLMDFFAFALPNSNSRDHRSFFSEYRALLDHGYEVLGQFKDLYDSQGEIELAQVTYPSKQLKARRAQVLQWYSLFRAKRAPMQSYFDSINGSYYPKKQSLLSDFYWGKIEATPEPEDSLSQALKLFVHNQIQQALDDYKEVQTIKNPGKNDHSIEAYHDFRKRIRTLLKFNQYFPEELNFSVQNIEFLAQITQSYGIISDTIVKFQIKRGHPNRNLTERQLKQIEKEWKKIQDWEKTEDVPSRLKAIKRDLNARSTSGNDDDHQGFEN